MEDKNEKQEFREKLAIRIALIEIALVWLLIAKACGSWIVAIYGIVETVGLFILFEFQNKFVELTDEYGRIVGETLSLVTNDLERLHNQATMIAETHEEVQERYDKAIERTCLKMGITEKEWYEEYFDKED